MKLSRQKLGNLLPVFKQIFLKSTIADSDIYALLSEAELFDLDTNTILYHQGDPINHYYFLIHGMVGLYKGKPRPDIQGTVLINDNDFLEMIQGTKNVGEYFSSVHTLRQCSAVVKEDFTQVIKISKKLFDSICHILVTQYCQIQKYVKDSLHVGKKVNCFDIFNMKNYRLGSSIKLTAELGVIIKGECKVLAISNSKTQQQNSYSKNQLPPIFRINSTRTTKQQIALINENEWIFTQNLEENQSKNEIKFKYIVSSSSLCLLVLPVSQADILPPLKLAMLMKIHHERKSRVNPQQRLSCLPSIQREVSNSPRGRKNWKMDQAHKILEKLDPNLSPSLILKKYKLGYNMIRFENCERKQRNSLVSDMQIMEKQKTDRKLRKYYQPKDWSHYVKIPNVKI